MLPQTDESDNVQTYKNIRGNLYTYYLKYNRIIILCRTVNIGFRSLNRTYIHKSSSQLRPSHQTYIYYNVCELFSTKRQINILNYPFYHHANEKSVCSTIKKKKKNCLLFTHTHTHTAGDIKYYNNAYCIFNKQN